MREIPYVLDPDDRVGLRCYKQSEDGITTCMRRSGHPSSTTVTKKDKDDNEMVVTFNHRAQKQGKFWTW